MPDTLIMYLSTEEICRLCDVNTETVFEFVEYGIIEPRIDEQLEQAPNIHPNEWRFDPQVVSTAKKALRLHRDLEIEWPGIALAMDLLEEVQNLRQENQNLRTRLERFISDL